MRRGGLVCARQLIAPSQPITGFVTGHVIDPVGAP
jgi:hypothetical protein